MFGLFGVGNIGNEASLESALHALGQFDPQAHPVVVCADPEVVAAQHEVKAVAISMGGSMPTFETSPKVVRVATRPLVEVSRWIAALRFVRRVDAVIVPGTGILDDFGERPRGMPYDLFRWSVVARLARTPMYFVAVGAGPIDHRVSRILFRRAVLNATGCTYRDEGSRAFMEGLGVPSSADAVQPDVVFGLPRPSLQRRGGPTCVGVGMMAYYGWDNVPEAGSATFDAYVHSMLGITRGLLDRGCEVRVLVGEHTDEVAVRALQQGLHGGPWAHRIIVEPIQSFTDLLEQVARCDAVVASRYHNIVASMMMNRPTISIGYAAKNRSLLDDADLGRYAFEIDRIEVDTILAAVDAGIADGSSVTQTLEDWNAHQRRLVTAHFEAVLASLRVRR